MIFDKNKKKFSVYIFLSNIKEKTLKNFYYKYIIKNMINNFIKYTNNIIYKKKKILLYHYIKNKLIKKNLKILIKIFFIS